MVSATRRFPRTRLWQRTSSLHDVLDYWADETERLIDDAEDKGLGLVTNRLALRLHSLNTAIENVRLAKAALYDMP